MHATVGHRAFQSKPGEETLGNGCPGAADLLFLRVQQHNMTQGHLEVFETFAHCNHSIGCNFPPNGDRHVLNWTTSRLRIPMSIRSIFFANLTSGPERTYHASDEPKSTAAGGQITAGNNLWKTYRWWVAGCHPDQIFELKLQQCKNNVNFLCYHATSVQIRLGFKGSRRFEPTTETHPNFPWPVAMFRCQHTIVCGKQVQGVVVSCVKTTVLPPWIYRPVVMPAVKSRGVSPFGLCAVWRRLGILTRPVFLVAGFLFNFYCQHTWKLFQTQSCTLNSDWEKMKTNICRQLFSVAFSVWGLMEMCVNIGKCFANLLVTIL